VGQSRYAFAGYMTIYNYYAYPERIRPRIRYCVSSMLLPRYVKHLSKCFIVGPVWRIGRDDAFRPKGHGFDNRSSRHVGTLGKFLTHNCLWRFGVKLPQSICVVSLAPLSSGGLEETL